ncbi:MULTISPECIES: carbohydrate ABC transporter permease [Bradyrhizobium]|jgi:multiple sugar transport system permease protein|uniref:carbohydrate ABC transporter permease n=2 Tax=Nitrobacteraceae TaxID=41294 RepID=UPI0003A54EFB|nr:carbohydrate ABC transporter permease [Bradyrhizobium denitrificans]MCL8483779.1 carbohydrate ABC transporter permease [Bradyrhizobium denitrificans]
MTIDIGLDGKVVSEKGQVVATERTHRAASWLGLGRMISALLIALYAAFLLLPISFLVSLTFKTRDEVLLGRFLTDKPTLENWWKAFQVIHLTDYVWHSVVIASLSAVVTLIVAAPATYAAVRLRHGAFLGSLALSSYVAPPVVALLPLFFLMRWLGLLNSFPGMILLYGIMNVPVAYWLLLGFLRKIPSALDEAAWIDGAGFFKTFLVIDLPLLAPGLVATGLICLILAYNEFLFASLFAQDDSVRGLTVAISLFQGDRFVNFGQMAVASLVGIAPIYVIALLFQDRLIGGLTAGSVK